MITESAPVVWFDLIDSTNEEAARRARAGAPGPLWIEAGAQTAGRGRRGRAWLSEHGNVFVTYLGRTALPPAKLALLGFAAAVAVADIADDLVGAAVAQLKWPNDVLIRGAKLSGILMESGPSDSPHGGAWFALGVGINCVSPPEAGADRPMTALERHGVHTTAYAVRRRLRAALAQQAELLETQGFEPIRTRWRARAYGLGQPVRAQLGADTLEGRALDLLEDGALAIAAPDGRIHSISAGEVYFT